MATLWSRLQRILVANNRRCSDYGMQLPHNKKTCCSGDEKTTSHNRRNQGCNLRVIYGCDGSNYEHRRTWHSAPLICSQPDSLPLFSRASRNRDQIGSSTAPRVIFGRKESVLGRCVAWRRNIRKIFGEVDWRFDQSHGFKRKFKGIFRGTFRCWGSESRVRQE